MAVRQNWMDVLISKISLPSLFPAGEHVYFELFIHALAAERKWFQISSRWKFITISLLCVQRGMLSHSSPSPSPSPLSSTSIHLFISLWRLKSHIPNRGDPSAPSACVSLPLTSSPSLSAPDLMTSPRGSQTAHPRRVGREQRRDRRMESEEVVMEGKQGGSVGGKKGAPATGWKGGRREKMGRVAQRRRTMWEGKAGEWLR